MKNQILHIFQTLIFAGLLLSGFFQYQSIHILDRRVKVLETERIVQSPAIDEPGSRIATQPPAIPTSHTVGVLIWKRGPDNAWNLTNQATGAIEYTVQYLFGSY